MNNNSYETLDAIQPGASLAGKIISRFGTPIIANASGGGLFLKFPSRGLHVLIEAQKLTSDAIITEVTLQNPSTEKLPCGIFWGQPQSQALHLVHKFYEVIEEFEDAIYFRSAPRKDLVASVEFKDQGVVLALELIYDPSGELDPANKKPDPH